MAGPEPQRENLRIFKQRDQTDLSVPGGVRFRSAGDSLRLGCGSPRLCKFVWHRAGPNVIPQRRSKVHRSLSRSCHYDPRQATGGTLELIAQAPREKTVKSESILE